MDNLDADGRSAYYARLSARNASASTALTRLQLAYLLSYPGSTDVVTKAQEVSALIGTVDDAHLLAPIRDLLAQQFALQQALREQRRKFRELSRDRNVTDEHLQDLQRKQLLTQEAIATCREQLDALKQIESMMSDAEPTLQVQP